MNRLKTVVQRTLLPALIIVFLSAGCGEQKSKKTDTKPPETHEIDIKAEGFLFYFQPEEITIKQGDTVRWISSKKGSFHLVFKKFPNGAEKVLSRNGKLESPELTEADETWEVQFTGEYPPGEYHYVCSNHEDAGMQGWIEVKPRD